MAVARDGIGSHSLWIALPHTAGIALTLAATPCRTPDFTSAARSQTPIEHVTAQPAARRTHGDTAMAVALKLVGRHLP